MRRSSCSPAGPGRRRLPRRRHRRTDPSLSEASTRAHLDLRDERAVPHRRRQRRLQRHRRARRRPPASAARFTNNALLLSPRVATIEGRDAAIAFLVSDPIAPSRAELGR